MVSVLLFIIPVNFFVVRTWRVNDLLSLSILLPIFRFEVMSRFMRKRKICSLWENGLVNIVLDFHVVKLVSKLLKKFLFFSSFLFNLWYVNVNFGSLFWSLSVIVFNTQNFNYVCRWVSNNVHKFSGIIVILLLLVDFLLSVRLFVFILNQLLLSNFEFCLLKFFIVKFLLSLFLHVKNHVIRLDVEKIFNSFVEL